MSIQWNVNREEKDYSRDLATQFTMRKSALFMPASEMLCVLKAEQNKMICPSHTNLILVERNKSVFNKLLKTIKFNKWQYQTRFCNQELSEVELNRTIDYAWIDLNGSLMPDVAHWLQTQFSPWCQEGAVLCFTVNRSWRGNLWLERLHKNVNKNWHKSYYSSYRYNNCIMGQKLVSFTPFVISCALRDCELELMEPFEYGDTTSMILYRFVVRRKKNNPRLPNLLLA